MQEGRIFPDDYRKVQIKSVIPISVSIVILVTTYMAITLWSSDHPEILQWSPYVLLTILLVLDIIGAVKSLTGEFWQCQLWVYELARRLPVG